ncbi:MAG TPA: DMT family transporter [Arsenicitalea sp.]|jgi:drug/metabolite transporter (DMT)-like permease|nr:DMT family transporter [Arsenicitalea sp.]
MADTGAKTSPTKIILLTLLAMLAFAANSVLARLALGSGGMDAAGYTGIRLAAGAIALTAILLASKRRTAKLTGSWSGAAALFGYAIAFSLAYLLLGAGTGALILFGSVQLGMLGWGILKGDRPGALEWLGLAIAFAALAYLVSPGLVAPHPIGAGLMIVAGLCWAAYSLLGGGSTSPLSDTTGNFVRCLPLALVLAVAGLATHPATAPGIAYAIASGALASGVGYAIWYAALPHLTRTRAAIVQLSVPALAAFGGVIFIGEAVTPRLVIASIAILGGVALAIIAAERRKASAR